MIHITYDTATSNNSNDIPLQNKEIIVVSTSVVCNMNVVDSTDDAGHAY